MFMTLKPKSVFFLLLLSLSSCASSSVKWQGDIETHERNYMASFKKFRERICVPRAEAVFQENLKAYRGQGYWIPELNDDVDVKSIISLIPEFEKNYPGSDRRNKKLKSRDYHPSLSLRTFAGS